MGTDMNTHTIATLQPRPMPADHVIHTLALAHRAAWGELICSQSVLAGEDVDALVRAIALIPARTPQGLLAKASVLRDRFCGEPPASAIGDGVDGALILSLVNDAIAQSEGA